MAVAHFKGIHKEIKNMKNLRIESGPVLELETSKALSMSINHYMKICVIICYIFSALMKQNNHQRVHCTCDSQIFISGDVKMFLTSYSKQVHSNCLSKWKLFQRNHVKTTTKGVMLKVITNQRTHGSCCLYWTDFQHYYSRTKDNVYLSCGLFFKRKNNYDTIRINFNNRNVN